jgi:exopolysaccharide production protein ExoY
MRVQLSIKRLLDIVCAITLLLMLLPVLIVAAVCVRMSSKGPVLYKQERYGWRGSTFVCLKFRSMFVDLKEPIDSQTQSDRQGMLVKVRSDTSITPMGIWLRRTSIDELPQLLNVLRGEMSMVGPRPLEPYLLEPYPEFRGVRDQVRPGITGLWQISARDPKATAIDMMPYDLEYIRKISLWLDFKILLKTPVAVFLANGAR